MTISVLRNKVALKHNLEAAVLTTSFNMAYKALLLCKLTEDFTCISSFCIKPLHPFLELTTVQCSSNTLLNDAAETSTKFLFAKRF